MKSTAHGDIFSQSVSSELVLLTLHFPNVSGEGSALSISLKVFWLKIDS